MRLTDLLLNICLFFCLFSVVEHFVVLWLHRQYLLVGIMQCWCESVLGIYWQWDKNKISSPHLFSRGLELDISYQGSHMCICAYTQHWQKLGGHWFSLNLLIKCVMFFRTARTAGQKLYFDTPKTGPSLAPCPSEPQPASHLIVPSYVTSLASYFVPRPHPHAHKHTGYGSLLCRRDWII